jgi:cytoplasmic iron level regulating protein YaaA (DUF328/UPF0246 family)
MSSDTELMMLAILSPAKNLDFSPALRSPPVTLPAFPDETTKLVSKARRLSRKKLRDLMHLSKDLAELNHQRFQSFDTDAGDHGVKQAILAFKGDTYIGFDANSLDEDDLKFAQDHVRILSGLYGLLRPFDGIQPYRLEMGTKLPVRRNKNLYEFWGSQITDALNELSPQTIFNLASKEYFSAVRPNNLGARVITPVFKDVKDGNARQLFMFIKQARGMMARYMVTNRVTSAEDMKKFNLGGYKFMPKLSTEDVWEFHRKQPPPVNR